MFCLSGIVKLQCLRSLGIFLLSMVVSSMQLFHQFHFSCDFKDFFHFSQILLYNYVKYIYSCKAKSMGMVDYERSSFFFFLSLPLCSFSPIREQFLLVFDLSFYLKIKQMISYNCIFLFLR